MIGKYLRRRKLFAFLFVYKNLISDCDAANFHMPDCPSSYTKAIVSINSQLYTDLHMFLQKLLMVLHALLLSHPREPAFPRFLLLLCPRLDTDLLSEKVTVHQDEEVDTICATVALLASALISPSETVRQTNAPDANKMVRISKRTVWKNFDQRYCIVFVEVQVYW